MHNHTQTIFKLGRIETVKKAFKLFGLLPYTFSSQILLDFIISSSSTPHFCSYLILITFSFPLSLTQLLSISSVWRTPATKRPAVILVHPFQNAEIPHTNQTTATTTKLDDTTAALPCLALMQEALENIIICQRKHGSCYLSGNSSSWAGCSTQEKYDLSLITKANTFQAGQQTTADDGFGVTFSCKVLVMSGFRRRDRKVLMANKTKEKTRYIFTLEMFQISFE